MDERQTYDDQTLERELREALRGEAEIGLFKQVRDRYRVKDELANSAVIKAIVQEIWDNCANFFEEIVSAPSLIGLGPTDDLVKMHYRMQADWRSISAINRKLIEGRLAEEDLVAEDQMDRTQESGEPDE